MSLQDSVKVYRVEYNTCINGPSVDNDKHIALAINQSDYYNNRLSEGANDQHSINQTENPVKEWEQKTTFLPRDTEVPRNSLQVGLVQTNLAENNYAGKGFQNRHQPICNPLKVFGSISMGTSEYNGDKRGYTKFYDEVPKSALTNEGPPETKAQNGMSEYSSKRKIDGEAIVDLAANKHNRWNRTIHDYLWCPFILFFFFFCCAPAIVLMHKSDIAFRKGRDSEARRWAIFSSLLYGIGLVLTLAFYAMIFGLVVIFAKYELY